MFALPLYTT